MSPGFGARTTRGSVTAITRPPPSTLLQSAPPVSYRASMGGWRRVSLVGPTGTLRAPGQVVAEIAPQLANAPDGIVLTGHLFGHVASYARLLCRHLGKMGCAWAIESDLVGGHDPALLRLAWTNGCRALLIGPDPDPLLRDAGG